MKKFLLGFVIGILFVALAGVILVAAAVRFGGSRRPQVVANSALVLQLEGDLPEQSPVDFAIPFLQDQQPPTIAETWQMLRNAAADSRIKAIVLEPRGLSVGWAKLEELHADILNFKKSGKPVYAFLRSAGTKEYYLASAADKIYMAPEDELDVKGLRAELMFVKGTLDKLGVQMEFEHVGKYKDAPDMFTKNESSPETREVINQVLDQFYGDFVNTIAEGRKKAPDAIRAVDRSGPFRRQGSLERRAGGCAGLRRRDVRVAEAAAQALRVMEKIAEHDYVARAGSAIWVWTGPPKSRSWSARATSRAEPPTIRAMTGSPRPA